jgi:hypothetical protein
MSGDFERLLRVHHAEGKIDGDTFKALLDAYRLELEARGESASRSA